MRMILAFLLLVPAAGAQTVRLTIPLGADAPARARLEARALAEMGAVVLTGVGHLVASEVGVSTLYVPVVIVGWGGYLGVRAATEAGFLAELGLTGETLGRATRDTAWLSAGAVVAMGAYGLANGSLRVDPSFVPLLLLYPAWGLTQQLLVQGFVTRHLDAAGLPAVAIVPLSAATFGSVHLPNLPLTAATTTLGGAFAGLYLRDRNVWPLGVSHGALGTLFYVWVLDRDPWAEFTGRAD